MSEIEIGPLPDLSWPLLNKFYREHRSPKRAAKDGQAWVARQPELLAALSLGEVEDGYWLTGLFVAPERRGQGLARRLIEAALFSVHGPTWLFCHPQLLAFYQPMGFEPAQRLPRTLGERLMRYSRSKPLIALCRMPSVTTPVLETTLR